MPTWVNVGFFEYAKRLPRDFQLNLIEIPMAKRTSNSDLKRVIQQEGEAMLKSISSSSLIVALDEHGKQFDTKEIALQLQNWRESWQTVNLLIGGPEGLSPECLQKANLKWSLSRLTLPHPLVRIVVAEQIYRAWTILHNHPYHRA